ncbi:hypothetical protein ES703_88800 [subsurface metagenome]
MKGKYRRIYPCLGGPERCEGRVRDERIREVIRMRKRRRPDLTEKVRDAVVRDYLQGDKTIVIQMEYKISPGEMYRVLHSRHVSLRKAPDGGAILLVKDRPKCKRCGRDYDKGLRKDGQPYQKESMCWICTGWAADYRGPREVYNQDGSKVTSKADDPWERGKPTPQKEGSV